MNVTDTAIWMDGGTMTIDATLQNGELIQIELVQNVIIQKGLDGKYAGQLYFNQEHVDPRSELEKELLEGLKETLANKNVFLGSENSIVREKIEYIESEQYLSDLEKMKNEGM